MTGRIRQAGGAVAGALTAGALVATLLVGDALRTPGSAAEVAVTVAPEVPARQPERDAARGPFGPFPTPRVVEKAAVLTALHVIAAPAAASLNAVVLDEGGQRLLATSAADRPVPSASLAKLLVVQQLLDRSAAGVLTLGPADRERMERAITVSDDRAMSRLWVDHDGARLVADAAAEFGLTATAPPEVPGQWGEAPTSAADGARFLAALTVPPVAPGADTLLEWMRGATARAADGFDQRFGFFAAGPGTGAAVKQGWMCCVDGRRHLHSVGVLADGRIAVLLSEAPTSSTWAQLRRAVDDAAAALVAGTA
ncbi:MULTISPECIES: LppW family protein [unclassified Modestobacter]